MRNSEFHNPHSAGSGELALLSRYHEKSFPTAKFKKRITQAVFAGVGYGLWAIADAYANPLAPFDMAAMHADALLRGVIVVGPTALLQLRRGPVSVSILGLIAAMNTGGHFLGWILGDPESSALTVAAHAPFLVLFVRGAHAAFRLRRSGK